MIYINYRVNSIKFTLFTIYKAGHQSKATKIPAVNNTQAKAKGNKTFQPNLIS